MERIICFDLEGPLSPQDNAYEVLSLAGKGRKIFELLSRYDDVISLEGRKGYEPGDTLALILPFLDLYGLGEEDVARVSERAKVIRGAPELISFLRREGWLTYIISTSYHPHAYNIAKMVGVPRKNVYCTKLRLSSNPEARKLTENVERELLKVRGEEDMISLLDSFYWEKLPRAGYNVLEKMRVIGGSRKTDALMEIAKNAGKNLEEVVAVGDSITDFKMLEKVREEGGVALVFNGNEYAIPYANVSLASLDLRFLYLITSAFPDTDSVLSTAEKWELLSEGLPFSIHCLSGASRRKIERVIEIHKKYRREARGEAAKLG
jgi:energy-converting hydrogenase A subunit R